MFRSRTERRKKKLKKKSIKKAEEISGSQLAIAFRRFRKNKAGLLGLILTILLMFLAIFADFLAPYDPILGLALPYNYQPWYQPPGVTEASSMATTYNRLLDGNFEHDYGWTWGAGWDRYNLTEHELNDTNHGYSAAECNVGDVELTHDISSPGEDLFFPEIFVQVYLIEPEPTSLFFTFTFEDNSPAKTVEIVADGSRAWSGVWERLHARVEVRNPETVIISKASTGSGVVIDNIQLQGGEYHANLHILGTNRHSQDLFSKLVFGSRVTLIVSVGAIIISLIIGLPLGLISGYFRGKIDELIMRTTDIFLTLPFYFVMILVIVLIGQTQWLDNLIMSLGLSAEVIIFSVTIGLGLFGWMGITRLIRATILQVREMDYVEAARALGASNKRIMIIHVLPNILAPLIVAVTYNLAVNIVAEAGLAFLGYTDESLASWGRELFDGFGIVTDAWWPVLFPAMLIIAAVMAFNLFGDGLRDAFDPRIR